MIILAAMAMTGQLTAGLTKEQSRAIDDALFIEGLSMADLHVSDRPSSGNPYVLQAHRDPLNSLFDLPRALGDLGDRPLERIRRLFTTLPDPPSARRPTTEINVPDEVPTSLRSPLIRLIRAVMTADDEVKDSLKGLSQEERRILIEALPRFAVHPSLLQFDFIHQPMPAWAEVEPLLKKVDLDRIRLAGERLYAEAEATFPDLNASAPPSFRSKLKFSVGGTVVVLAGVGDDFHDDRDAMITVDLGGNDRYVGRHGAGIGYASVFVDLGGDDIFDVPDVSLGAGLLGIGLAWDLGGRDSVRTKSIALGSGIAGVGSFRGGRLGPGNSILPDDGDEFRSEALTQGFGFFGYGAMSKSGSSDFYRSRYLSQGAALQDGVGVLVDQNGQDICISTGLAPSLESDSILRSRSQGFGQGGIGILATSGEHSAGTEAQGCGLDGGFGAVYGSDYSTFRSEGYGQGYGEDQGIGLLLGGREFVCRGGAAQGIGLRSGIGLIRGSEAGDLYALGQGKQGSGIDGGLGILVDFGGPDRYVATVQANSQELRHIGLGLTLDLGGPNWTSAQVPTMGISTSLLDITAHFELPGVSSSPLAQTNFVGNHISETQIETSVKTASGRSPYPNRAQRIQARASLEASKDELVKWLAVTKRELHPQEVSLVADILRTAPVELKKQVVEAGSNGLRIAGAVGFQEAKEKVLSSLKNPATAEAAIEAAVDLKVNEAAPELMILSGSVPAVTRQKAAIALAYLGGMDALSTAQALLTSEDPIVRLAAIELIGRLKPASLAPYQNLVAGTSGRMALRALGAIGSPDALNFIGPLLNDRRPEIRVEALRALNGRCPKEFRQALDARREDPDLRVRAVAMEIDPGR